MNETPAPTLITSGRDKNFLLIADTHCGHLYGLTPPEYWSDEYVAFQKPLWEGFQGAVRSIPVKLDGVWHAGDAVEGEGKKGSTAEHVRVNLRTQQQMAIKCLDWIDAPRFDFVYGTPYHTAGSFSYEEGVAEHFRDKGLGGKIADTLYFEINGRRFSIRHVVGRSDTDGGQGTQTAKEAGREDAVAELYESEAPEFMIRGHAHYEFQAGRANRMVVILPCLKLPKEVLGRKLRTRYYDLGVAWLTVTAAGRILYDPKLLRLRILLPHEREYIKL